MQLSTCLQRQMHTAICLRNNRNYAVTSVKFFALQITMACKCELPNDCRMAVHKSTTAGTFALCFCNQKFSEA